MLSLPDHQGAEMTKFSVANRNDAWIHDLFQNRNE